ncbi:hypothetical protein [Arthrobacter sp. SAFR-044]|uniref:hypothetical protein n=1 Tax=Arthrobacter sp. SAFR-044 TaxID=3387278 RepID=UPI003F7CA5B0
MPIRAWIPVESLDDDLLTLESAAVLSLLAKYRTSELSTAIKKWQQVQLSFDGSAQERARVERAITVLRSLLKSTGLVLPSLLKNNRLPSLETVTNEMSSIVRGPLGIENSPQAAVALLNLACDDSLKQAGIAADLLDSQLINRAWRHIRRFVTQLLHSSAHGPAPKLKEPLSNDWMAHEPDLLGDYTPWSLGIGPMFHTLAGWDSTWFMRKGMIKDELWKLISYWTPLPHLALGPLGWSDPALGVARWILMGMPNETRELSLVSRVWGTDALMYFAHPQADWLPQPHTSLGFALRTSGRKVSQIYETLGNAKSFSECGSLHMHVHLQWQLGIGNDGPPAGDWRVYSSMEGCLPKFVLELEKWQAGIRNFTPRATIFFAYLRLVKPRSWLWPHQLDR